MRLFSLPAKFKKYFKLIFFILLILGFSGIKNDYAACSCERAYCLGNDYRCEDTPATPDRYIEIFYPDPNDQLPCVSSSDCCYYRTWGDGYTCTNCGNCPWSDYGDVATERVYRQRCLEMSWCGTGLVPDAEAGGGSTCNSDEPDIPILCEAYEPDGTERTGVRVTYNSTSQGGREFIAVQRYKPNIAYDERPTDSWCDYWFVEHFYGWINMPAGWTELRTLHDEDLGNCDEDGEDCEKCDDDNNGWNGVMLGYTGSGTAADPYRPSGSIVYAGQDYPQLNGMSQIIWGEGPRSFSGTFRSGWYPVYAWYLVGQACRDKDYELHWRQDPATPWYEDDDDPPPDTEVPTEFFRPCGPSTPPVSRMTSPATGSYIIEGANQAFSSNSTDPDDNVASSAMYARQDLGGGTYGQWCRINTDGTCTQTYDGFPCNDPEDCDLTRTWNNMQPGRYQIVTNAYDQTGAQCTGNPDGIAAGWFDCDSGADGQPDCTEDDDCIAVTVDRRPICNDAGTNSYRFVQSSTAPPTSSILITGPGQMFGIRTPSYDLDYNQFVYRRGTQSCDVGSGTFITDDQGEVVIRAKGSNVPGHATGEWPRMRLYAIGAQTGGRYLLDTFTVDSTTYTDYSSDNFVTATGGYYSHFEIIFDNDGTDASGNDKNLYIDYITYYPDPVGDPGKWWMIQGEHAQNSLDRRGSYAVNYGVYDGMDTTYFNDTADPLRDTIIANNQANMYWDSSLRFPKFWFAPASPGGTCTIASTPRSWNGSFAVDSVTTCDIALNSNAYGISGNFYRNDDAGASATCTSRVANALDVVPVTQVTFNDGATLSHTATAVYASDNYNTGNVFWGTQGFTSSSVLLTEGIDTKNYTLFCVEVNHSGGQSLYDVAVPGSNTAATTFNLNNANATAHFYFRPLGNEKWFTVNNGDIYTASGITADISDKIPVSATDQGLFGGLIYRYQVYTDIYDFIGGNTFMALNQFPLINVAYTNVFYSEPDIASPNIYDRGVSKNLGNGSKSQWIDQFSFEPPSRFDAAASSISTLDLNDVYYVTPGAFTSYLSSNSGTYSLASGEAGDEGVTIMYVNGDLTLNTNVLSNNSNRYLILVVKGKVEMANTVGQAGNTICQISGSTCTYLKNERNLTPNVQAVILARDGIETLTKTPITDPDDDTERDVVAIIDGSLLAGNKGTEGVAFPRDLGRDINTYVPAEIVRYNQKILYWLTRVERDSTDYADSSFTGLGESYTGLGDFGVEFIYED